MNVKQRLKQLKHERTSETLSDTERAALREELLAFMDMHPIRHPEPRSAPLVRFVRRHAYLSGSVMVSAACLLFILFPAGEQHTSTPVLLPLEHLVYDPADDRESLVRTFNHVETQVLLDSFDPADLEPIQNDIQSRITSLQQYMEDSEAEGDLEQAASTSAEIEDILEAHLAILASLSDEANESTSVQLRALVSELESQSDEIEALRRTLEDRRAADTDTETLLEEYVHHLELELDTLEEHMPAAIDTTPHEALFAHVYRAVDEARTASEDAKTRIAEGDTETAIVLLREALRSANRAGILLGTALELTAEPDTV